MSSINYGAVRGEEGTAPPDGLHDAYLMRARLQTGAQDFVVTEWQAGAHYWETLYGFTPQRLPFTNDMLDGLGIDRSKLTDDDALEAALADAQGGHYRVRVEHNGRFVNTYLEGAVATQAAASWSQAASDIPADTTGLPEPMPWDQPATQAPPPVAQPLPGDDLTDEELNDIFQ